MAFLGIGRRQVQLEVSISLPVGPEEEEISALDCAWCLGEQGVQPVSGSHGICPFHAGLLLQQVQDRRNRRGR